MNKNNVKDTTTSAFLWGACASFLAMLSVAIGAFAAHGLKASMSEYQLGIIDTAAKYQMYHALTILVVVACMLALNALAKPADESKNTATKLQSILRQLKHVVILFALGILLFSGSLFFLAFTGAKFLVFITPVGGIFFLIAWLYLGFIFIKGRTLVCS